MPALRKPTNETYVLVCDHEKDLFESIGVVFLSATGTRLFSTKSSVPEAIHSSSLASAATFLSTGVLVESGSKLISASVYGGTCITAEKDPVFLTRNGDSFNFGTVYIGLRLICTEMRRVALSKGGA